MTVNGSPLDPEQVYKVATTMYLAKGGDGYSPFTKLDHYIVSEENGRILPSIVRQHIQSLAPAALRKEAKGAVTALESNDSIGPGVCCGGAPPTLGYTMHSDRSGSCRVHNVRRSRTQCSVQSAHCPCVHSTQ